MLRKHYEPCGALRKRYRTVAKHCGTLRSIMEPLQNISTLRNRYKNIDFEHRWLKFKFCSSLKYGHGLNERAGTGSEPYAKQSAVRYLCFVFHISGPPTKHICWSLKMPIHAPEAMGEQNPRNHFPLGQVDPRLMHPCCNQLHSPLQTAFGSTQPFCHNTVSRQTDRQTHRSTVRPTDGLGEKPIPSGYARERRTKNWAIIW